MSDEPATEPIAVPCPWCDSMVTPTPLTEGAPVIPPPGAPLICTECATPMIWTAVGNPRRPLEHEWARLNLDERVTEARKAIFMATANRTRGVQYKDFG